MCQCDCGCSVCESHEYSCRTVCTEEGKVFYYNDCKTPTLSYKAFYGRAFDEQHDD